MKTIKRQFIFILLILAIGSTGCMEHRYYQKNHEHSERYNQRHHHSSTPRIDIDMHN